MVALSCMCQTHQLYNVCRQQLLLSLTLTLIDVVCVGYTWVNVMSNQCWLNVGPASTTPAQHQASIGSVPSVFWIYSSGSFIQQSDSCWSRVEKFAWETIVIYFILENVSSCWSRRKANWLNVYLHNWSKILPKYHTYGKMSNNTPCFFKCF